MFKLLIFKLIHHSIDKNIKNIKTLTKNKNYHCNYELLFSSCL